MMLRRFTDFILQNRLQAMGIAFALAFLPLIGSLSILIAALVTLRKGAYEGALVFLAASLPVLIRYMALPADASVGLAQTMILIVLGSNFLVWLFAVLLRAYGHWSVVLEMTLLFGILFVGLAHVMYPELPAWWEKELSLYAGKALAAADDTKEVQAAIIADMKNYATGFVLSFVLINVVLQLLMARWWQAVIFNPGGLRKELYDIRLKYIAGAVFLAVLLLSYLKNAYALDMMPLVYMVYALAGLSLLHYVISCIATRSGWFWLLLVYTSMILLFPFSVAAIAVLGLFDTGLDLRKRLSSKLT